METASLSQLRKELKLIPPQQLQDLCLRMAKYKKENKELLSYLLFDSINEQEFIKNVKEEIDDQFLMLNKSSAYLAKKTLRKVLRTTQKHIKFSGIKETEIELLLYFCRKMRSSGINMRYHRVIQNMYWRQAERIKKVHATLHEDLQFDYEEEISRL